MIKGFRDSYEGVAEQANRGFHYLNPFLSTSRRVFSELTCDTRAFEHADRRHRQALGPARRARRTTSRALVGNAERGARRDRQPAGGARRVDLSACPTSCGPANTTFVNLRAALDDLDPLVEASKPGRRAAAAVLRRAPRRRRATRCRRSATSSEIVRRPGRRQRPGRAHPRRRSRSPSAGVGSGTPDCGSDPNADFEAARRRLLPGRPRRDRLRACRTSSPRSPTSAPTPRSWSGGSTGSRPPARSTPAAASVASRPPSTRSPSSDQRSRRPPRPARHGHRRAAPGRQPRACSTSATTPAARRRSSVTRATARTPFTDGGTIRLRSETGAADRPMRRLALIAIRDRRRRGGARRERRRRRRHAHLQARDVQRVRDRRGLRGQGRRGQRRHGHGPRHQRGQAGARDRSSCRARSRCSATRPSARPSRSR